MGISVDELFNEGSRNIISIIFLSNAVLINFIEFINRGRISIWPAIITMFFSIVAIGRSGIGFSFLYLLLVIYYHNPNLNFQKRLASITLFIILVAISVGVFLHINREVFELFSRFSEMGINYSDDARSKLFNIYLSKMNFIRILFGYNISTDKELTIWNNVHNSFISLHALFGIFAFIIMVWFIVKLTFSLKYNKILFAMILVYLGRAFFDAMLFNSAYDFIAISFLLINIKKNSYIKYG